MDLDFLLSTPVFSQFTPQELHDAFRQLKSRQASYRKAAPIFLEGTPVDELGIVLEGSVTIERIDYTGNRNILGHCEKGQVFAESYAMLPGEPLMVDVVANQDTRILFLNLKAFSHAGVKAAAWYPKLIYNLLLISNRKNLELSNRSFHTFSRHIRGRVFSYLNALARSCEKTEFDIPFNRQQMADYLNVDRSALSNELCRMRDEGLIAFKKNHFNLLYMSLK